MSEYLVYKADKNLNPIEGTDRVFIGSSLRKVMYALSLELKEPLAINGKHIKCKDGSLWHGRLI